PDMERLLTHQDWLRSLARRLVGDAATAEDLVQETWMAAMKSPPDPSRPARPWLAGGVRRLASMRARGEGRRARRQNEAAKMDILPSTAELVEEVDTQRRLVAEVLELSEPYRTTIMLRYFQNMSSAEIARHQGVPAGTVRWRLKRGLDELRARLDASFGSRDSWCIALLPLAKLSLGSTAATGASATTAAGTMALIAKVAAGLIAVWGLFEVSPFLASKARLVFAQQGSADLVSLTPETGGGAADGAEKAGKAIPQRDSVVPEARRVRFLHSNREPVKNLLVAFDDGSDLAPTALTNDLGEVEFLTAQKKGDLYIQQEGSFLQHLAVEFTAMGVDVQLTGGAQLTGRVLAKGDGASLPGLDLHLDSDQILWGDGRLPRGIAARFERASWIDVTTDEFGAFQFNNLAPDWSGKLWLPAGVVVEGGDRRSAAGRYVYFDRPSTESVVAVERLPILRGRTLGADGHPVLEARVQCWLDGADTPLLCRTDDQGQFEVQLDSHGSAGMRVDLIAQGEPLRRTLTFAGGEMPEGFDLGDVYLSPTQRLAFQAVDSNGDPVVGARVVQDGYLMTGEPSDMEGFGEVLLPADAARCFVHAFGFQPLEILARPGGELQRLELTPAARLSLHVTDDQGRSLPGATLRLRSGLRLFDVGEAYEPSPMDARQTRGRFVRQGNSNGLAFAEFETDEGGRLTLSNLILGNSIGVDVLDRVGQPVLTTRLAAMGAGDVRKETLVVTGRLHGFQGLVHDRAGNVLVGVEFRLADLEGNSVRALSGMDGKVQFQGLAGSRYDLTVAKRGYVTQTLRGVSLSDGEGDASGEIQEITLDRAADLLVRVVSGANVPVSGGTIVAQRLADGRTYEAAPRGSSDQAIEDLDQGALELTLRLGGVEYTETGIPHMEKAVEFRVPAHGSARVHWDLSEAVDGLQDLTLVATALDVDGGDLADRTPVRIPIGERTGNQGVTDFPALLPGGYRVVIEGVRPTLDGSNPETVANPQPLSDPVEMRVGLKGVAQLELRL
ncbi:MAG: sigma-70 family RNA polymerase sigma factor, partial [Planctomycetes bacterium]|nr:sigma-70 family RNA polymerase sigma factor [Planctomycetota bacterium]